ncbi:maltodextrin phosphorylase [Acetivibrio thermocellus AD2]|jgi:starch phosphorylase|uniref:Maltodextrin phosphorylase n=1 Tax=Acetivibrio thermocellus AD2 TaxID=1138384 RepID=A0AB36TGW4_ACETH|nr:alpha-glucan family phosphorylase [Acetivibrio thermocellus]CDG35033.1 alpha-glucan phosphorylase [Acetivibrio thermocellus BC1]ADU74919.1 alpha-glucan phosphorylase [Acetivibrio thermocellus DSM 1313]ALX08879.1 alpha-glucan phosphorylase [Acetivibrio thermocellus AD2]ANV76629.1 alpha-glucan phosphorylase [Acetivibrio thermocellus DSM 2360]EIC05148.1 alpha-glucan phosphorylase [Acetivibrio thermocellus YS]
MYLFGKITVTAVIPDELSKLKDIAYNLWWSWNSEAIDLFREIDLALWEKLGKNPVRFLKEVSQKKLEAKLKDPDYMQRYKKVVNDFETYMNETDTWFSRNFPDKKDHMVAYFSAEYGLNEVLPIYSGGLGVLSGDHCKSASDLGIPFTAIGLFYKEGYFSQRINSEGWQETIFTPLNPSNLPIQPALNDKGEEVIISVELPGRVVYAKVWVVKVGRVNLYLMDTDIEQNSPYDRGLTARLYGGDQETRIQQEIFLGIGGARVLDALGIKATVYHMNEGHSAFLGLELIRKLVQNHNLPFNQAKEVVASSVIFTTHTPVPAGNDVFPLEMIDRYFGNYWPSLGINRHEFLDLGLRIGEHHNFNMTVLALTLAGQKNGVSELHGAVSRNIFKNVWPGIPEDEIPIGHITNGIHTLTWLSPSIKYLYDKYLDKDWKERLHEKEVWEKVDDIPDEELWKTHCVLKTKMIGYVREKLKEQRAANGESIERIKEVDTLLDSNALTIGFARRFATYKRANLIFRDLARIQKLLNNPEKPVQIIFAGKAHPADGPAHEIIKHINDIAKQEGFNGKVILVENYNMTLARNLVQGVDIWLNNPRRPLEASGTSGQKVAINGIINFSVLDGWWCEGYNGKNGWAIGDDTFYDNEYHQDNADSESIYNILEKQIIPTFFDRNEKGVPEKWVKIMKESIKSIAAQYSTHRMVQDYINKYYIPAMERYDKIKASNYQFAANISEWKKKVAHLWPQVQIIAEKTANQLKERNFISGESIPIYATVNLGGLEPSDVKVQAYYGSIGKNNSIENPVIVDMDVVERNSDGTYLYSANITLYEGGEYGYTFRVIPNHPDIINPFDLGLIRWIVQ